MSAPRCNSAEEVIALARSVGLTGIRTAPPASEGTETSKSPHSTAPTGAEEVIALAREVGLSGFATRPAPVDPAASREVARSRTEDGYDVVTLARRLGLSGFDAAVEGEEVTNDRPVGVSSESALGLGHAVSARAPLGPSAYVPSSAGPPLYAKFTIIGTAGFYALKEWEERHGSLRASPDEKAGNFEWRSQGSDHVAFRVPDARTAEQLRSKQKQFGGTYLRLNLVSRANLRADPTLAAREPPLLPPHVLSALVR